MGAFTRVGRATPEKRPRSWRTLRGFLILSTPSRLHQGPSWSSNRIGEHWPFCDPRCPRPNPSQFKALVPEPAIVVRPGALAGRAGGLLTGLGLMAIPAVGPV